MKLKTNLKFSSRVMIRFTSLFCLLFLAGLLESHAKIEDLFKGQTSIKDPMGLRDPFLSPKFKTSKKSSIKGKTAKGTYSNIPQIGSVKLDELTIIGVMIGPNRRAFAKIKNNAEDTFILKEGMKLGENKAVLKAILPGGLILVEKTTNIYGEDEYLETVIPISK